MAKSKTKIEEEHNAAVRRLEKTLSLLGIRTLTHLQWTKGNTGGEIDLVAIYPCGHLVIYEIKARETETGYKNAKKQYERFLREHQLAREEIPAYVCFGNLHAREL